MFRGLQLSGDASASRRSRWALGVCGLWSVLACSGLSSEPVPPPVPVEAAPGAWFPLQEGVQLRYELHKTKDAGLRIFFVATRPETVSRVASWQWTILEAVSPGRHRAEFTVQLAGADTDPALVSMEIWMEDDRLMMDVGDGPVPGVVMEIPPFPTSSERLPCSAPALGVSEGLCAPAWGGPRSAPPGLQWATVEKETKPAAEVARFLVGLITLGTAIPGAGGSQTVAEVSGWTDAVGQEGPLYRDALPEVLQEWFLDLALGDLEDPDRVAREIRHLVRTEGEWLDAETSAVLVGSVTEESALAAALAILPALPEASRWSVARVAVQRQSRRPEALLTLARVMAHLPEPIPERFLAGLQQSVDRHDADAATRALLVGDCPLSIDILRRADLSGRSSLADAVLDSEVAPGEADVDCFLKLQPPTFGSDPLLPTLFPLLPESQRPDHPCPSRQNLGREESQGDFCDLPECA